MNDPKLTDCPQEGCPGPVKRLLGTGGGIIFKGGSSSYKEGAKAEKSAPKTESKSESKSESKPAKKSSDS